MSAIFDEVLKANGQYAGSFGDKGKLAMPPARRFAILTCMDARLDPAKYAGLAEGDAHVIRNAGGRASDDAVRSLVISHKLLATNEWFVIHHTDCGMLTFTNEVMSDLLDDNLETAGFDGKKWVEPQARRRQCLRPFHQLAHDQRSAQERGRGRQAHPHPSAGARLDPDLRLHLRLQDRPHQRGEGGERRRQADGVRICPIDLSRHPEVAAHPRGPRR